MATEHVSTQGWDDQLVTFVSPLSRLSATVSESLCFLEICQPGPGILDKVHRSQLHAGLLVLEREVM